MFFFGRRKLKEKIKCLELELCDMKEIIRMKDFELDSLSYCRSGEFGTGEDSDSDGDYLGRDLAVELPETADGFECRATLADFLVDMGDRLRHYKSYRDKFERAKAEMRTLVEELEAREERIVNFIRANGKLRRRLEHMGRVVTALGSQLDGAVKEVQLSKEKNVVLSNQLEEAIQVVEAGKERIASLVCELSEKIVQVEELTSEVERYKTINLAKLTGHIRNVETGQVDKLSKKIVCHEANVLTVANEKLESVSGKDVPVKELLEDFHRNQAVVKVVEMESVKDGSVGLTDALNGAEDNKTAMVKVALYDELEDALVNGLMEEIDFKISVKADEIVCEKIVPVEKHELKEEMDNGSIKPMQIDKSEEVFGEKKLNKSVLFDKGSEEIVEIDSKANLVNEVKGNIDKKKSNRTMIYDDHKEVYVMESKLDLLDEVRYEIVEVDSEADLVDELSKLIDEMGGKADLVDEIIGDIDRKEVNDELLIDTVLEEIVEVISKIDLVNEPSREIVEIDSKADVVDKIQGIIKVDVIHNDEK